MAVCLVGIGVQLGRSDKGESNGDTDNRVCVPDGDRNRGSDIGHDSQIDPEEVIAGLQNLRMALSRNEKEWIDYACDCIQRINELQQIVREAREDDNDD
jgi:hypothetical protein